MTEENNDEIQQLAHGVLTETLHGPVPMETVAKLAQGVLDLQKRAEETEKELASSRAGFDVLVKQVASLQKGGHDSYVRAEKLAEALSELPSYEDEAGGVAGPLERVHITMADLEKHRARAEELEKARRLADVYYTQRKAVELELKQLRDVLYKANIQTVEAEKRAEKLAEQYGQAAHHVLSLLKHITEKNWETEQCKCLVCGDGEDCEAAIASAWCRSTAPPPALAAAGFASEGKV